jgi:hypothetical protein
MLAYTRVPAERGAFLAYIKNGVAYSDSYTELEKYIYAVRASSDAWRRIWVGYHECAVR